MYLQMLSYTLNSKINMFMSYVYIQFNEMQTNRHFKHILSSY